MDWSLVFDQLPPNPEEGDGERVFQEAGTESNLILAVNVLVINCSLHPPPLYSVEKYLIHSIQCRKVSLSVLFQVPTVLILRRRCSRTLPTQRRASGRRIRPTRHRAGKNTCRRRPSTVVKLLRALDCRPFDPTVHPGISLIERPKIYKRPLRSHPCI